MTTNNKTATIFGGTGFIGRQVVRELADRGVTIKVASRQPERAYFLRPCGTVGQIVPVGCDYSDRESVTAAIRGSDYVVNCIGILYEKGKATFESVHTAFPETIASLCKEHGVERFVHISALAVERGQSRYAQSKKAGEDRVLQAFPEATILRPSIVFGPEDEFFNKFARLSQFLPALPLIGGGDTRFQPVFVGDVADAVMAGLTLPPVGDKDPRGKIYELGGPEIITFKEVYERLFKHTGRRRLLMPLPWLVAKLQAHVMKLMPEPLLTPDQVESLKTDNVVNEDPLTLEDLEIQPTGMSLILHDYLSSYAVGDGVGNRERAG